MRPASQRTIDRASRNTSTTCVKAVRADAMVGRRLADVERELVLATLARCAGNRTWAADMLGLAPLELRDRLLSYGRESEAQARAVARREAEVETDLRRTDGRRPTYVPSPALLA